MARSTKNPQQRVGFVWPIVVILQRERVCQAYRDFMYRDFRRILHLDIKMI
jgi:hypothetical protein